MKKQLIITVLLLWSISEMRAQVGIGVGGGVIYPGFLKSDLSESQFEFGAGYEIFARHKLFKLSDNINIDAKYSYRKYYSQANLPFTAETRFTFDYLVFDLTTVISGSESFQFYAGAGVSLTNVQAAKDFLEVNETEVVPEVLAGMAYFFSEFYNIFMELSFQYGAVKVREDKVPFTGMRLMIGATMFLTE
jgi:opacity protein-like surface antigen